jgi:Family of unknown function (DUF6188)
VSANVSHHEMPLPDLKWMIGKAMSDIRLMQPASWSFGFVGGGSIRVDTFWRVVADGRVQATSDDHGQQFGLPQPIDSGHRAARTLSNATVRRASIINDTGDVVLDFENGARLEILTTSTGYEGWSLLSPNRDEAIGLGGGDVALPKRDG